MAARPNHKRRETGSEDVKKKKVIRSRKQGSTINGIQRQAKKHKTMQSKDEFEVRQENMIYKTFDSKRES